MSSGDSRKTGDGAEHTDAQFDHSDDDTPVEVKVPRDAVHTEGLPLPVPVVELERRSKERRRESLTQEALRAAYVDFGKRLSSLEDRLSTIVDRLLDVAVSDQDHDEKIAELRRDFESTRADVHALRDDLAQLKQWLEANRGP